MSEFDDWWEKHYSMANLARGAAEDAWNAAVAHERERCAKIADKVRETSLMGDFGQRQDAASETIAEDIRAGK